MKNKFIALQLFLKISNKQNSGFTLIELLVVIIIIGILSAIALPSFLNQTVKARQSEAKNNIGAMNRSQQAYYFENQEFAEDTAGGATAINKLGIGIKNSVNYRYAATSITAIDADVTNKAQAQQANLKGYAGGVFTSVGLTQVILCEVTTPNLGLPGNPVSANACDASNQIRIQ
ncbi:type IV pilin-like G/H family protein [Scytonema millei]|uniref:Prepilin-type N-terminal cleavage/methylation domain-containing protein n=1 Tax=Scytonema millei VB511283 TaxID=1245923 RepID=A0A9X5I4D8_9CYAN|nr:type IV pilin-like G/H family protein [Scytonema millei]NHC34801.1 prepilin-type N-terminal cleavage/methylation domain-containing protein [Scytonema millei VB511283]